jgi:hypothetical protein
MPNREIPILTPIYYCSTNTAGADLPGKTRSWQLTLEVLVAKRDSLPRRYAPLYLRLPKPEMQMKIGLHRKKVVVYEQRHSDQNQL